MKALKFRNSRALVLAGVVMLGVRPAEGALFTGEDVGLYWWQDSVWDPGVPMSSLQPLAAEPVFILHDDDHPMIGISVGLPEAEDREEYMVNWGNQIILGSNRTSYILGNLTVSATGNPGGGFYWDRYGFANSLGENGLASQHYGLRTGDVQVGYAGDRGTVANFGAWRIDGRMNIDPYSLFRNAGLLEMSGHITLQGNSRLEVPGTLSTTRLSMAPTARVEMDGGKLSTIFGFDAGGSVGAFNGGRLEVGEDLGVSGSLALTSSDGASGTAIVTGSTGVGTSGEIHLEGGALFKSSALTVNGVFDSNFSSTVIEGLTKLEDGGTLSLSRSSFSSASLLANSSIFTAYGPMSGQDSIELGTLNLEPSNSTAKFKQGAKALIDTLYAGTISQTATSYGTANFEITDSEVQVLSNFVVGGDGGVMVGQGGNLHAGPMRLHETGAGTGAMSVSEGGRVTSSGTVQVGGGGVLSVSGQSRVSAASVLIGRTDGGEGIVRVSEGGTVQAALQGIKLGDGSLADGGRLLIGGADGVGNPLAPGLVDAPSVFLSEGSTGGAVEFHHGQKATGPYGAMSFQPAITGVGHVESTGPGATSLLGRLTDVGVLRSNVGLLTLKARDNTALYVQVNGGDMTLDGGSLETDPTVFLSGTSVADGKLSVIDGGELVGALSIPGGDGTTGTVEVDGQGAVLRPRGGILPVGQSGAGYLRIRNGGSVLCDTADGNTAVRIGAATGGGGFMLVGDGGSFEGNSISVGYQGSGDLRVEGSARVSGTNGNPVGTLFVGDQVGGGGTLEVTGGGMVDARDLRVGNLGYGTLEVSAGTLRARGPAVIGKVAAGDAVIGENGVFLADEGLHVAEADGSADSSLTLQDGGIVRVDEDGRGQLMLGSAAGGANPAMLVIQQTGPEDDMPQLLAASVNSPLTGGAPVGRVSISHHQLDYEFSPALNNVHLFIKSSGKTYLDQEAELVGLEIYDGTLHIVHRSTNLFNDTIIGSNYGNEAWLKLDGTFLSDGKIRILGGTENTGLILGGYSFIAAGQGSEEIVMGRPAGPGITAAGGGMIVFTGSGPGGEVDASAIRGIGPLDTANPGNNSAILFDNTGELDFSTPVEGNISIFQRGGGRTVLDGAHTYAGDTGVTGGQLIVNGNVTLSRVEVTGDGLVGGTGRVNILSVEQGGCVSPGTASGSGDSVGILRSTRQTSFGPGGRYRLEIGDWAGSSPGTHWDQLVASDLLIVATPGDPFVIEISGPVANFQETAKSMAIVQLSGRGAIANPADIIVDDSDFPGAGTWSLRRSTTSAALFLDYTPGTETPFEKWARLNGLPEDENGLWDDPDKDGMENLAEFALDRNPMSGVGEGKQASSVTKVGGFSCVYFTLPVRRGAVFGGSPALVSSPTDGVVYRIEAGDDLNDWNIPVMEVTGSAALSIHSLMPPLSNANWTYRTFRSMPGAERGEQFIRCAIMKPEP